MRVSSRLQPPSLLSSQHHTTGTARTCLLLETLPEASRPLLASFLNSRDFASLLQCCLTSLQSYAPCSLRLRFGRPGDFNSRYEPGPNPEVEAEDAYRALVHSILQRRTHLTGLQLYDQRALPGFLGALALGLNPCLTEVAVGDTVKPLVTPDFLGQFSQAISERTAILNPNPSPGINVLTHLELHLHGGDMREGLEQLLLSPPCRHLQGLAVSGQEYRVDAWPLAVGRYIQTTGLPALQRLELVGMYYGQEAEDLASIFNPGVAPRLESLTLNKLGLGTAGLEKAGGWGGWARLRELTVVGAGHMGAPDETVAVLQALVKAGGCPNLLSLTVSTEPQARDPSPCELNYQPSTPGP